LKRKRISIGAVLDKGYTNKTIDFFMGIRLNNKEYLWKIKG